MTNLLEEKSLFGDVSWANTRTPAFPRTQYLGSKERLVDWIFENSPKGIKTIIDAFSGTSVVGYHFKTKNVQVLSNDFLKFNFHIAKALIENKNEILTQEDIDYLIYNQTKKQSLIEDIFTGVFFEKDQAKFLDNFRANVDGLENDYKKSLALVIMNRALTRKILLGHFAHLSALRYSKDKDRIKRNPSIARPIQTLFNELVGEYNQAVFNNNQHNKAYCENTIDFVRNIKNADLAYFDPPYCGCHPDYQAFYHFLETFVEYWSDKEFVNGTKMYSPKKESGFVSKKEIHKSFEILFKNSSHIPAWLISYNSKSYPKREEMIDMIKVHKKVKVFEYEYQNNYGGKGSKKGTQEYLFYCYE